MKKAMILIVLAFILVDLGDGVIGDGFHPGSQSPSFHFIKPSLYHPPLQPIEPETGAETTFVEIISCENLHDPRHAERNKKRGLLRAPPGVSRHVPVKFLHGGWNEKGCRLPGEGYSLDRGPGYTRSCTETWSGRARSGRYAETGGNAKIPMHRSIG